MAKTKPAEDTEGRHRREAEAEAARRGIPVSKYLRSVAAKTNMVVALHARVRSGLVDRIDAEATAREMSRADVVRDMLERAPAHTRRVTGAKG